MIRCPRCGRRLPRSAPACAQHGEVPGLPGDEEEGSVGGRWDREVEASTCRALLAQGFECEGVLGRGGFGVVLAGRATSSGQPLAIKLALADGKAAQLEMESEAAAMLRARGPAVPEVLWHGEVEGRPVLVIERVSAPTLAAQMERFEEGLLGDGRATALGLIDAVEQVHHAGLLHLDLKPENVFVHPDGRATLIDFGLARAIGEVRERAQAQGTEPVGTAEYMSPEQCDDVPDLDVRADLYGVGVLLYEMLSGAPPFWGSAADVREAQRSRRVPPLPPRQGLSSAVDGVVRSCLAKDRERRPASMAELREALCRALAHSHLSQPPIRHSERPGHLAKRRPEARRGAAGVREKHKLGLVFFRSSASIQELRPLLVDGGGEVAQSKGEQYTVALGHEVSDNPAATALALAHRLVSAQHTKAVLVDVATVTVQTRSDGTRRYFGAALMKKDRMPAAHGPGGVLFTRSAVDVLGDIEFKRLPESDDRYVIAKGPRATGRHTTFGTRSTPLVGRTDLVEGLLDGAHRALSHGVPTLADIGGKPGYGRTHLAAELADRLETAFPGARVLRLAAQQSVLGSRGRVVPQLLAELLDLPDRASAEQAQGLFVSRFGEDLGEQVWAAGAFAMGYIDASHPAIDRLAAAPGALRSATSRAVGEALRLRAGERPVCVLLDDAHLADEAVLDGLEYAALHDGVPLFACLLVPERFREERPAFGSRAGRSLTLQLQPLAEEDAIALARRLLQPVEHVPRDVLRKLLARTQCVPRLLVELVRGLKRDGIVRRNSNGTGYHVATDELDKLPDLPIVQWNARREVEALPSELAGHARLASVLGGEFSVEELDCMVGELERCRAAEDDMLLDPAVGLKRLESAHILRRHASGHYSFRYSLLRETIYELVTKERRKVLHAAALAVYERATDLPEDHRCPRIAMHAARSGQCEKAARAYLSLGKSLLEAQAYLPAEAALSGALENMEDDDERAIEAGHLRGLARFRLGLNEDALADLNAARHKAQARGQTERSAEILLDESTVLDWRYEFVESAELVRQAASLLPAPGPVLAARLAGNMARVHNRAGEAEKCIEIGLRAAEQAAQLGEAGYETRVIALLMTGFDCVKLGRLSDAQEQFEVVIAEAEAHADLHHLAAACVNRASLWLALNQQDRFVEDLSRASSIARDLGEGFVECIASYNLADGLVASANAPVKRPAGFQLADAEDEGIRAAAAAAERAVRVGQQLWGESIQSLSLRLLLARVAAYAGDVEASRAHAEEMRARLATPDGKPLEDPNWAAADEAFLRALEFFVRPRAPFDVSALERGLSESDLEPAERLEVAELHARGLLRVGRCEEARVAYEFAAHIAASEDNPLSARVLRDFRREFSGACPLPASQSA